MDYCKYKNLSIISVSISIIVLIILVLLLAGLVPITGCKNNEISVPEYTPLATPPKEVEIEKLVLDFKENEITANIEYKDVRIIVNEVEVEEVVTKFYPIRREGFGMTNLYVEYFSSGGCKFKLRDFELMQNVQVGYVLNLVGNCDGLFDGWVTVTDCYAESVIGDLTATVEGVY